MLEQCAQPQRRAEREVRARLLRVLRLRALLQPGTVRPRATHRLLLGLSLSARIAPISEWRPGLFRLDGAEGVEPSAVEFKAQRQ